MVHFLLCRDFSPAKSMRLLHVLHAALHGHSGLHVPSQHVFIAPPQLEGTGGWVAANYLLRGGDFGQEVMVRGKVFIQVQASFFY